MMRFEPWACEVSGICLVGGMMMSLQKSNSSIQIAGHNIKGLLLSHRLLLGIQLLGPYLMVYIKFVCNALFCSLQLRHHKTVEEQIGS